MAKVEVERLTFRAFAPRHRSDVPTDADGIRSIDLLDSRGLLQHVKRPTYIHGHTLDLLITRQSDNIIAKESETERYFSGHAVVLCYLRRAKPTSTVKLAEFRKLKAIDMQKILEDIRTSSLYSDPPDILEELVECYENTLRTLLDKRALVRSRHITNRSRPPWFNNAKMKTRRHRRRTERKWRTSKLDSDFEQFKARRNYALYLMNVFRRGYYKQYTDDSSSDQ